MSKTTNLSMTRPFSGIKVLYLILTIAGSIEPWFWLLQDPCQLDVTDPESMTRLAAQMEQAYGRLDILVNNAGILYDTWQQPSTADFDTMQEAIDTNTLGPWRMCKAFAPLLRRSQHGRIINVSSGAGSIASMDNSTPAYSVSKAALNAFTRSLAAELNGTGI
ncbi:MAG: hypothetical protein Kow00121_54100 [Elainellaceae cyanobacterium]